MLGIRFLKIAAIYFVVGVLFGMYMSITQQFQFTGVHAHINLLGWASLGLSGLIYWVFPRMGESIWGKIHFWLYNLGLPVMMIFLTLMLATKNNAFEMGVVVGSIVTTLGVLSFLLNIFLNINGKKDFPISTRREETM